MFKINNKNEQTLLSRTEVQGTIEGFTSTPSNKEITKKIAESIKSKEDLVVVKQIKGKFGKKQATFKAYVYKDSKSKEHIEVKTGKKALEKQKKADDKAKTDAKAKADAKKEAEEKPAEAKKESAKPEEKKVEAKAEPKKEEVKK